MGVEFTINGRKTSVEAAPDSPLLWALRDNLRLHGVKFGCGAGLCGACTVHVDGEQTRSCQTSLSDIAGKNITTIEGLSGPIAKAVMDGWIKAQAPQCGYCQPGFVMAAVSVLSDAAKQANGKLTPEQILGQLTNLCRCGSYDAIRLAVGYALAALSAAPPENAPQPPAPVPLSNLPPPPLTVPPDLRQDYAPGTSQ